jgi:hypothetical protein
LRAIAGLTYPLVNSKYTPDGAAKIIYDLENPNANGSPSSLASIGQNYKPVFPYLAGPHSGFRQGVSA